LPWCPSSDRRHRRRHRHEDRDESAHFSAAVDVMTSRVFLSWLYFRYP